MNHPESVPSASEYRSERIDLQLWKTEVREFCEDALRQLNFMTQKLDAELHAHRQTDGSGPSETRELEERDSTSTGIDSSRSRLENLKRQLSEKLRQNEQPELTETQAQIESP